MAVEADEKVLSFRYKHNRKPVDTWGPWAYCCILRLVGNMLYGKMRRRRRGRRKPGGRKRRRWKTIRVRWRRTSEEEEEEG